MEEGFYSRSTHRALRRRLKSEISEEDHDSINVVGLFAHLSAAETLLVTEQYPTIQSAIDSSQNGDEISVGAGHEEVYISGNKELKIFGREPFGVLIDPSQGGACLAWYGSVR